MTHVCPEPVGVAEIADRLDVSRSAVEAWRSRGLGFPEPAWTVGRRPAWDWTAVQAWAVVTGRYTG